MTSDAWTGSGPSPWFPPPRPHTALFNSAQDIHLAGDATAHLSIGLRPVGSLRTSLTGGVLHLLVGPTYGFLLLVALPPYAVPAPGRRHTTVHWTPDEVLADLRGGSLAAGEGASTSFRGHVVRPAGPDGLDVQGMLTLNGVTDLAVVRLVLERGSRGELAVTARSLVRRDAHDVDVARRRASSRMLLRLSASVVEQG